MKQRLTRASILALCTLALSLPLASPANAVPAVPSDTDISRAHSAEAAARTSLNAIESTLIALSAESDRLEKAAMEAQEAADQAERAVYASIDAAEAAQGRADEAKKSVEETRAQMAAIAQAIYRDSASDVSQAYYFFDAESLANAHSQQRAYTKVIEATDAKAREFKRLEATGHTLQAQADAKLLHSQELAEKAQEVRRAATDAAHAASDQLARANAERDSLAVQLAQAHHTTVELERQKLAGQEAARAASINAQNQARITQQARRDAAAVQAAQATPSVSPAPAPSASGQAIRNSIVAYAVQFRGARYVWGGTSPTSGWDCSGFVQYVYRQFGYNLPRGGDGQGRSGRIVSAAEAQPGDIVWWPGKHVAIYLGGGRTFAARNEALGTDYSTLYGSYVFVRIVE